jgi:outer membrane receptor for ferrienterochelin and colicins
MRLAPLLLSGLTLLGSLLTAPLRAQGAGNGVVAGQVVDSADHRPIEGATVLLSGTLLSLTTDARGQFAAPEVPAGSRQLHVIAVGYHSLTLPVIVPAGDTLRIQVALARAMVDLPGLEVTASRTQQEAGSSPASVAVMGARELAGRNVTTLDEALPFVPGITINNSDITIRGSTGIANGVGSRVLLLLDGHPVLTGDGGEVDFEEIPLLDIERVEVVKGAYSALYGSNALGGVINMITRPLAESPQTVFRGHFGLYQLPSRYKYTDDLLTQQGVALQHSRSIGDVGVRVFAGRETTDGYTQNGEKSRWLLRAKAGSLPGALHPWDAYVVFAREIDHDFFSWRSPDRPFEVDTLANALGDNERSTKLLVGGSLTPVVGSRALLSVSPYFNYNHLRNDFRANDDYHDASKAGSLVSLLLTPREGHALTVGVDGGFTRVTSNFLGGHDLKDAAAFLQYDLPVMDRIRLQAGSRLDYHGATGGEGETTVNPKVGLLATPSSGLSLRASVARGYRAPSAIEQFVNTVQFGFQVEPNPALKGERAWSGELGFTATRGRLWLDAAVFQSSYRGLIGPAPDPGKPFVFQFQNVDRARIRGFDGGVRVQVIHDLLDLQGTYLFIDSKDLKTDSALVYRSRHTLTGTAEVLGGLLGVDVRFRSRPERVLVDVLDPRTAITVVDLRLGYRLLGAAFQLKVGNLFQKFYVNVQERVPGPPRSFSLTAYHGL